MFDYIIAGQGLAGSCLAVELLRRRKRIVVFDQPRDNHASAVAAGLFNPMTGRIMARTWMADPLFKHLFNFYREAEHILDAKFFFPTPVYRPFASIQEQNGWMGKSADAPFAQYIENIYLTHAIPSSRDPFGGLMLKQSGYVDVRVFMSKVRDHLVGSASYKEEKLDVSQLRVVDGGVEYQGHRARGIIFCEGMGVASNPWFSWLPINPLKGETVTIRLEPQQVILNKGVYVVPAGEPGLYTAGATYDFTSSEPGTTPAGRMELSERLDELLTIPYEIIAQNWGARPTTLDQKIMIGAHPEQTNLLIFNGLGTKGVSQAPYFATHFAGWLEGENEILREVNIARYKALYSKSR